MKSLIPVLAFVWSVSSFKLFNGPNSKNEEGKIWAVLVAGANTWDNYRHQANVAHAFHTLKNHGVQEENIITLMYDDIANSPENPFPGKLYNGPDGENGTDYYEGLKIDYRGDSVNQANFLAILQGEADKVSGGNGRVLKSTQNDKLFVYFTDHGDTGVLFFPGFVPLSAYDLNNTLANMHAKKLYKELVIYVEACESGSVFDKILPTNINIYVVTAAGDNESSFPTYCNIPGKLKGICIGDVFSDSWMENSDKENLKAETLQKQFEIVKQETNTSHVHQFGSLDIAKEPVANFQGDKAGPSIQHKNKNRSYETWPSREVPVKMLEHKLKRTNDENEKRSILKRLAEIEEKREYMRSHMESLIQKLVSDKKTQQIMMNKNTGPITQFKCHSDVIHAYSDLCFNFGSSLYAPARVLANLCESGLKSKKIIQTMKEHCKDIKYKNIV